MCVGTSQWCRGEHYLGKWPIPTQLLVWGTLFAVRCNPWSGRWDPAGWVMVNVCNRVHCHWQYTTSAWSSCRWEVRNGPTWSIGWSRQAQEPTNFVLLNLPRPNIVIHHLYLLLLGRWLGSIRWFPHILPEYINHVSLAWLSGGYPKQHVPLLDSVVGGGHGWWTFITKTCQNKRHNYILMGPWKGSTPRFRACHLRMMSPRSSKKGQKWLR